MILTTLDLIEFHVFTAILWIALIVDVKKALKLSHNDLIVLTNAVTIETTADFIAFHILEAVVDRKFQIATNPFFKPSQAFNNKDTKVITIAITTALIPSQTV